MDMYNFDMLSKELEVGREIEFEYNKNQYSITNSTDGYWYFYCDSTKKELLKICEFDDKQKLIKTMAEYKINGTSIRDIFDLFKYNIESLTIL